MSAARAVTLVGAALAAVGMSSCVLTCDCPVDPVHSVCVMEDGTCSARSLLDSDSTWDAVLAIVPGPARPDERTVTALVGDATCTVTVGPLDPYGVPFEVRSHRSGQRADDVTRLVFDAILDEIRARSAD